jgi:chromosome partitioning protein
MKILIFNQKGGVGKTTTAVNLGAALARLGRDRVTLVDLDPQTHLTAAWGLRAESHSWNVSGWLAGEPGQPVAIGERLFLVPGDCQATEPRPFANPLITTDGVVIIDAPPSWNDTVARLMTDIDRVLTPLEADFLGMQGINRLLQTMKRADVSWSRLRLLVCRYDVRLAIHREVRERLVQRFRNGALLPVVVRSSVRLAEAPGFGVSIFDHAPASTGAMDYEAVARIFLNEMDEVRPGSAFPFAKSVEAS